MVITLLTYLGLRSDDSAARLTEAIYRSSHFRSYLLSPTCCLNGFINAVIIAVAERLMFCMLQSRSLAGSTFPAQSDDIACRLVSSPHPLTGGLRCLGGGRKGGGAWTLLCCTSCNSFQSSDETAAGNGGCGSGMSPCCCFHGNCWKVSSSSFSVHHLKSVKDIGAVFSLKLLTY